LWGKRDLPLQVFSFVRPREDMDRAIENFKMKKVSDPIDLSDF